MLKLEKPNETTYTISKTTPEVYLNSVIVKDSKNDTSTLDVHFSLEDPRQEWINNEKVLNNIKVFIFVNKDLIFRQNISTLTRTSETVLRGTANYQFVSKNISVRAYTGNKYIVGNSTTETVLLNNEIPASSYLENQFIYINKFKDLRILKTNIGIRNNIDQIQYALNKNIYISYNKDKKANLGFYFNLRNNLNNKLSLFKSINGNNSLSREILKNIVLTKEDISVYKKQLNPITSEYQKIQSNIVIKKLNQDDSNKEYFVTLSDDNQDINNFSEYSVKVKVKCKNYFYNYIKEKFIDSMENAKKFIIAYTIITTIESLSYAFSVINSRPIDRYYRLFSSIFHPLTNDQGMLEIILEKINVVIDNFKKIFFKDFATDQSGAFIVDKDILLFEETMNEKIDYGYDNSFGCDIIRDLEYSNNDKEAYNGILTLTPSQFTNRLYYELDKYIQNDDITTDSVQYLTISNLLLGNESFYLLNPPDNNYLNVTNTAFIRLGEYNNTQYKYSTNESIYQQILQKNVYIKQLSEGKNKSNSKFFKTLLFDNNYDSKNDSSEKINSYDISTFLMGISDYTVNDATPIFLDYTTEGIEVNIINHTVEMNSNTYNIDYLDKDNIKLKAANIFLYNNFYFNKKIFSSEALDLYILQEALVNDIFTSKLKIFNQYYVVEKMRINNSLVRTTPLFNFKNNLKNYNIPNIYLNRNITPGRMNSILEEL